MKRMLVVLLAALIGLIMTGCSQQEVEEEPQFLEVELTANPEKAELNEEITFEAKITYGTEKVEDADEVKFEIWRSQAEEHEKIVVEHDQNGIYSLKKSFDEEGTYYIISHVTARRMHNMPKIEFIVGSPSEPEEEGKSSEMKMDDKDSESEDQHGH
ncbi:MULTISPECIES: FixH family protein [Mesobacillus]|uniref:FixH family protein n=1 Tax=Mesobacillus selenatarsenatis TaxID=388741 RepID=A0A846TFM2_9BACI|nr:MULTISPECIES: FixH family protein [Mesobacillus]NKE07303.1 FixH family protein [Mesobacillus selenatarsenatis]